jgi:hypothetical protein
VARALLPAAFDLDFDLYFDVAFDLDFDLDFDFDLDLDLDLDFDLDLDLPDAPPSGCPSTKTIVILNGVERPTTVTSGNAPAASSPPKCRPVPWTSNNDLSSQTHCARHHSLPTRPMRH